MIEKYTQPSAYLPDFDHGSCSLAATISGGLLLVILTLIRLAKSWRGPVGVPWRMRDRRKGMVADVEAFKIQSSKELGRSVRSLRNAIIRVWTASRGRLDARVVMIDRAGCLRGGPMPLCVAQEYMCRRRLPRSSLDFYDGIGYLEGTRC